jgi:lysozyme
MEVEMSTRQINQAGLDLIRNAEGCVLHPYKDGAGKPTIGIGHLILPHEHFGKITEQQADELLQNDLRQAERSVESLVTVPLNDNQFAALVSFTFNLGAQNLRGSTLLRDLNAGDYRGAADQFKRWVFAGGTVEQGLVKRRSAERDLFLIPADGGSNERNA